MDKTNFDNYAKRYDQLLQEQLHFFADNNYFAEYKINLVKQLVLKSPRNILEYGCGIGRNIPFLKQTFSQATIAGFDISVKSLELAHENNPDIEFYSSITANTPTFDLIFLAGVMHHISPELRAEVCQQLFSLLNKGGELFIFEHNPVNPVTRYMVNHCEFDEDAVLLYPKELKQLLVTHHFHLQQLRYTLFFPNFLQKLRFLERHMGWLPLGGQYVIHAVKPV